MRCLLATSVRDTKTPYRFLPKKSAGGRQIGLNLTTIDLKLRKRLHLADGKGCGKPQTENPPPATTNATAEMPWRSPVGPIHTSFGCAFRFPTSQVKVITSTAAKELQLVMFVQLGELSHGLQAV
jgi:hypothetical protein